MKTIDDSGRSYSRKQYAVAVRSAFKQFGNKSKANPVLVNLNMSVAKGTIYGLLGASGCGKTTLLSCLVGRRKLNSGEMWVLGGKPATKGSGVPGKRVGYMPQELALYGEFSIEETMMYFGWIFGMTTHEISDRLNFLLEFLELPPQNRLVKSLSGGQQRRVSFAVALMHDPELLILDEPTVGVDPLLRRNIWSHLVNITKAGQKTVIITTHYIEEARQAHTIGLMRSGRLLSEESPQALMTMHRCINLEDVFLKLSRNQDTSNELNVSKLPLVEVAFGNKVGAPVYISQESGVVGLNYHQNQQVSIADCFDDHSLSCNSPTVVLTPRSTDIEFEDSKNCWSNITTKGKIHALFRKNFLRMWRNVGLMLFLFVLPVTQVILFCLAIGRNPTGLKLAIVNMEMNGTECNFDPGCSFSSLACRYLSHFNETILPEYYSNSKSAIEAVKTGQAWGVVYFHANFTSSMVARMILGQNADSETLKRSEIRVWLDMSNQQIGMLLSSDLQLTYRDFAQGLCKDCGHSPKLVDLPIQFKEPIYGTSTPSFTDFVAPGVILTILFFFSVAMTSSSLIVERTEGLFDRSWVAGVSPGEILFSHVANQFIVMTGQTALVLIFMVYVFDVTCEGNMFLIILLTLLAGMGGMCFGFVISVCCDREQTAMPVALGSFYPSLLLSGVIWPVEGMPSILRHISYCLPLTQAITSLRSILSRGWGFDVPDVYLGFIAMLSWIVLLLVVTLVVLKVKRE